MDNRLNIVVFLLFALSAIVVLGSGDKTELLFHLLIVSILGLFALYLYHKQTVEKFTSQGVCDKKVFEDELDGFYKMMLKEETDSAVKPNCDLNDKMGAEVKEDNGLGEFYNKLVNQDPLLELTDGKHDGNEELIGDGDFKFFFRKNKEEEQKNNGNDKWCNSKFTGFDRDSKLYSIGSPVNTKIGEYDGVDVNAEKYQYRRILAPGFNEDMVPGGDDQKCGSLAAPCKGVKINNPFHVTPEGDQITLDFGHDKPDKLNQTVEGHKKPDQNMFMFSHNKCSPGCCPGTYSCSTGCVCTTNEQRNLIGGRGNKSPYNQ